MNLRALVLLLIAAPALLAQTASITVVSAAGYQTIIAPDSLASIFGANLARTTATAVLDAAGQLPTELAATRIEVNGQQSRLIYVSPGQINFVVPAAIPSGTTTVLVRSTDTSTVRTAAVQISASAPAIFSSDASGSGPGAILNAVTFKSAPFVTSTADNGADLRTRLAVYGTGFRNAQSVTARATTPTGNRFDLTVVYAGLAPGFFGLDQLNFIVPPELDGAGAVSLSISTEDAASNIVTFQMSLLNAASLQLAGLALAPQFVNAGDTITATVSLNGVARSGGFPVSLRSSLPSAQVAPLVTIPEGQASVDAVVTTTPVAATRTGSISAQAGATSLSADFEIDPPLQVQLSGVSATPASTLGGRTLQGTVTLSGVAPAGGVNVLLSSDSAAVRPPTVVLVPFGVSSVNFPIATLSVIGEQTATLVATLSRTTVSTTVKLLPPISLSLDPIAVVGGANATGSVTLADPAPLSGANIQLASTDSVAARVPTFISISSGLTLGTFTITTSAVVSPRTVTIAAAYTGFKKSADLTVNPPPVPELSALTISPDHITGGQTTQGAVALTAPAPAGGMLVTLKSNATAALVPGFVIVPQGQASASFTIASSPVPVAQTATITATSAAVVRTATLTVQ